MTTENNEDSSTITGAITKYRNGAITWDELVNFFETFPWHAPDLPDAGDYLAWDAIPDTMQTGTWGEVIGAHLDELLTDDECKALMDVYDAIDQDPKAANRLGTVVISDDYDDMDVYIPEGRPAMGVPIDWDPSDSD